LDNSEKFLTLTCTTDEKEQNTGNSGVYIEPGKPTQNAIKKRFNKSDRKNVPDTFVFDTLDEVREQTEQWMHDYNHYRPYDGLNGKYTPDIERWKTLQHTYSYAKFTAFQHH
jgi:transposase InsO family protein